MTKRTWQVDAEITHLHTGTKADAVRAVRTLYPAALILAVDDEPFIGFCEVCGEPLFPCSDYVLDGDSVYWCSRHEDEDEEAAIEAMRAVIAQATGQKAEA